MSALNLLILFKLHSFFTPLLRDLSGALECTPLLASRNGIRCTTAYVMQVLMCLRQFQPTNMTINMCGRSEATLRDVYRFQSYNVWVYFSYVVPTRVRLAGVQGSAGSPWLNKCQMTRIQILGARQQPQRRSLVAERVH